MSTPIQFLGPISLPSDPSSAMQVSTKQYVDAQAKTFLPIANGTHFNGNGGATATAGLIQTRCRQTRKLLRVIAGGANVLQVEWANIWTSNTPQANNASCEIAGQQAVTARMSIEYPAGNPRQVSGSTAYSATTAYALLDQVTSGGSSWVCIQAGTGQTPAAGSAYWRQVNRYTVNWDGQTDTSGTIVFNAGDYRKSRPIALSESTRQGDCIAVLGAFDTGSSTGYLPYAGANGACNTAPFVDWVVDASGGLPAVGSALCDTGVTTQTNGNTTAANATDYTTWMKIPYATAITGNIPVKRCVALLGDSLVQGTGGDIRDGEPCGIFPRSLDGVSWWRIAQGGNRAGCYVPGNAPWQMSVVARCTGVITNLAMNDINANLTTAQVKSAMQTLWTSLAAQGVPVYAGYPTPISASSDSWATTANQSRFTNGGVINTTQNPTDDASYLTSVYGSVAMWLSQSGGSVTAPDGSTSQVGQRNHPLDALLDWRSLICDPQTSWKWNAPGYTTDGAHPNTTASTVQAAYLAQNMEPVLMGRQVYPPYRTPYQPVGIAPVYTADRAAATASYPTGTSSAAGTVLTALGVSPGRLYYGFRCLPGSATATAKTWTLLAGADVAKLGVVASGSFTPAASTVVATAIPGAPVWIPAGYEIYVALTFPASTANCWSGQAPIATSLMSSGLGFCISGLSTNTAALSGTVTSWNFGTAGAGQFAAIAFQPWAEIY